MRQTFEPHATLLFGTTYVGNLIDLDAYALVLMFLCKFVRDGLNVRVRHITGFTEREPVLSCLALLAFAVCSRPSSSLAIYRDYRPRGREKERTKDDDRETNGVSFFSPRKLSPRVIAAGLSSSSLSLCSRRTVLESRLVIQVPSSRELYA